jgi:tetratricopeptide (TPR) repeat protein
VLDAPSSYNEIPLASVAEELGLTLSEMNSIASDDLVEISTQTHSFPGSRITRQELARLHEVGADELLRLTNQELDEIFEDAVRYFHAGDIERAEKASKRMDSRVTYSSYTWINELALELLKGKYEEAISSIRYICRMDDLESTGILTNLGRVLRGMKFKEHGAEVLREQLLAITEGTKIDPFDKWYSEVGKQIGMNLDENQKHAMFLATAVKRALDRYKFTKRFRLYNSRTSEMRDEEFEGVIKDALYTALQAESTYYESAASKIYVDKLVASLPKWWVPAEEISILLPPNNGDDS